MTKAEYIIPERVVDLTPERFQNILDDVRPKSRELPKTKQEAKEYYRSMLKKLRWVIADAKRISYMAILHNSTIEAMVNNPLFLLNNFCHCPNSEETEPTLEAMKTLY